MVIKAKSENTIQPLRNVKNFDSWKLPTLDGGSAPSFRQPVEEVEEVTEQEQQEIDQKELQRIKDAAYQEGFNKGHQDGLLSAQEIIDKQSTILQQLINQIAQPVQQCGEETQKQLLKLSFAIARQIVRRELQQDPTQIIAIIRDGLKILPIGSQKTVIALHPEDAKFIKQKLLIESAESDEQESPWQIKSDPSVERGGCQVITENSRVNASIDQQIGIIYSKVAGGLRAGENSVHTVSENQPEANQEQAVEVDSELSTDSNKTLNQSSGQVNEQREQQKNHSDDGGRYDQEPPHD